MTEKYIQALKEYALSHEPNFGDAESVLEMLYEYYNKNSPYDNEQIKADFNELYRLMNGMELPEMDKIIYPVFTLCRDHEKAGFISGVMVGIRLKNELDK